MSSLPVECDVNIDDVLAGLDERLGVENGTEEKYCDCPELILHGQRLPMPRYHDCEYVKQRNALIERAAQIADGLVPVPTSDQATEEEVTESHAKWTLYFATAMDALHARNGST